jgi:hypothetical protein
MFGYLAALFISLSIVPCLAGAAGYAPIKEGDNIPGPDAARAGIARSAEAIDGGPWPTLRSPGRVGAAAASCFCH